MDSQERAFTVWLNMVLGGQDGTGGDSLADARTTARVRGVLWQLYSQDQAVISIMTKLEQQIDDGFLSMRDPVCPSLVC